MFWHLLPKVCCSLIIPSHWRNYWWKKSKLCAITNPYAPLGMRKLTYFPIPPSPLNEVWGKVIFLHLPVFLFTGVCPIACWDTPPDQRQASPRSRHPHPPWADTPTTPGADIPLPRGNRPPPRRSVCWEIRATSGRYVSYWNAILYSLVLVSIHLPPGFSSVREPQTKKINARVPWFLPPASEVVGR